MKYHAIGYLVILMLLSGCASFPVCPEIKLSMCPAPQK
jgi:hypothetical protein